MNERKKGRKTKRNTKNIYIYIHSTMLTHSAAHRSFSPKFDPVPSDKAKSPGKALKTPIAFCNHGAKESVTNTTKRAASRGGLPKTSNKITSFHATLAGSQKTCRQIGRVAFLLPTKFDSAPIPSKPRPDKYGQWKHSSICLSPTKNQGLHRS